MTRRTMVLSTRSLAADFCGAGGDCIGCAVSKYPAQRQEITTEKKKRARIRKVVHLIKNTSQSSQPPRPARAERSSTGIFSSADESFPHRRYPGSHVIAESSIRLARSLCFHRQGKGHFHRPKPIPRNIKH